MLKDRYDNPISTNSSRARDLYVAAVDKLLEGAPRIVEAFEAVVAEDPGFALGHAGLARANQATGNTPKAREIIGKARELATGITEREAGHINVFDLLANGRTADGLAAVVDHARSHPRDAMVVQTSTSIFGLIGFSGLPGREAEMLAFTSSLQQHYTDDWWYLSQYAFALCETGQVDKASSIIDRSMTINPRNAHGAHVRSHIDYEAGETQAGVSYLNDWLKNTGLIYPFQVTNRNYLEIMSKIRKSAQGESCSVRIPMICNGNPETTILAHHSGGGMGMKSSDWNESAYCCSSCHDALDGR